MKVIRLILCMIFGAVALSVQSETIDGISYTIIDDNSVGVSRLVSSTQKFPIVITIPSTVEIEGNSYNVISILDNAFSNISWCYGVVIPNSVATIGEYAFSKCDDLHHITIGSGVQSIGNNAFKDCQRLNKVIISDIESWCNITFGNVKIIDGVTFKSDLQYRMQSNPLYWAHHLFLNEEEISELIIPTSVTDIKDCTFIGGNFSSISFHNSIKTIGDASFCNCSYVEELIFPDEMYSIGQEAFSQIEYLKKISFGKSFRTGGTYSFQGDKAITEVYSYNPTPPNMGGFATEVFKNGTLYIPHGTREIYNNSYMWSQFNSIIEMEPTGIDVVRNDDNYSLLVHEKTITIEGYDGSSPILVVNCNGQTIYSGYSSEIKVELQGIYFVLILDKTFKVLIK